MLWRSLLSGAALLGLATAQVTTDCNPMNETDCKPDPAFGTSHMWNFNQTPSSDLWRTKVGPITYDKEKGAEFTINKQGDSPTLETNFYFFFGRLSFSLKAATGRGIVSSMMMLSDNLDEIDWEFTGTDDRASTNFFGKHVLNYENGEYHDMDTSCHDDYHNYTTVWTAEKMDFYIDEKIVRTVKHEDAKVNDTDVYPQTPMRVSLGIWAGGDPSMNEWTRKWAGGDTNFDEGPFTMYVKDAYIEDFSTGKEYVYGDKSGTWESIEIVKGNSTAYEALNQKPSESKSISEKFNELPQAAKISVYAGGAAVGAIAIVALVFFCIKQRRRGAQEARSALQASETDRSINRYSKMGIQTDDFAERATEYDAHEMKSTGLAGANYYSVPSNESTAYVGAAAVGAGAAMRSPTQSSFHDARSAHGGFASPPPPVGTVRSPSPGMMRSPGSPGPQQAYGASRMQHDSPFSDANAYGNSRVQSPGPSPMSPSQRSFSGHSGFSQPRRSPGPGGYRQ
ncbi:hydrolase-like protein [Emericellopsis atlantica]|uniref:chitinase n=1 Tax=Emericellopsis atlantica TaxID=2614577 RepID=A0A9P7ZIK7_9HYPO|nr:hydrolase-like protein [Emericellopsis atlantica]KAG9252457.1 hydrolase-like protein [Emericellopsis atlantica]